MASSTTNLDLILPVGGENVSRQIINANNVKIDEAVGAVPSGTDLQSQVTALNNNLTNDGFSMVNGGTKVEGTDCNNCIKTGVYRILGGTAHSPNNSVAWQILTMGGNNNFITQIAVGKLGVLKRVSEDNGVTWTGWEQLALKSEIGVPDWSNPTTNLCTVSNVGWTATGYGFIKVSAQWDRGGQLNINGVTIYYVDRSYYGGSNFHVEWLVPVKTGDIVKIIADNGTLPSGMNAEFYPLR